MVRGRGGRGRHRQGNRGNRRGRIGSRGGRRARGGAFRHQGVHSDSGVAKDREVSLFGIQSENIAFEFRVRNMFVDKSEFQQHYDAQEESATKYAAVLSLLEKKGMQFCPGSRARALAAAWARRDYFLADMMLAIPGEKFHVTEVVKALSILDATRMRRALEKKYKRLEAQGCKKKGKMAQLKSLVGSLERDVISMRSASGAVIRHVKQWTRCLPKARMEFHALHFPSEPWRKLADICHLKPDKDFPNCEWFLPYCFGTKAPSGTVVGNIDILTKENICDMVMKHEIDYTVVHKIGGQLTDDAKKRIATYTESLDTILWYYEELACGEVDAIIKRRLEKGEQLTMPNGKLMERILALNLMKQNGKEVPFMDEIMPVADKRLNELSLDLEAPVAVIGDMSGSMNVAIRTSNIIASLLAKICDAELTFFDYCVVYPDFIPKTVQQVIDLSNKIQARGSTCPAVALDEYYEKKKVIKTFFIVTDEGENGKCKNLWFHELFKKYHDEVFPAKLIFISFITNQNDVGHMVSNLRSLSPDLRPMQFRFDETRPDLTKLDSVFALLSTEATSFYADLRETENEITNRKLSHTLNSKCRLKGE